MHHKDNSVPRPFPGGRRMDLAQLAGFTSAFPCARRDAGCENRPETLLLPRESAPGPSLLCHGRGLRVTLPGVLYPARHTERSPPSWRPRPAARPGPPPPGGLPGRGLRAAPPPATPAAASSSPAAGPLPVGEGGPGPGRGACGFGPSIPLSGPPPSGRCPPGAAWHPRPTPRSHPCAAQTGFAIPRVKS